MCRIRTSSPIVSSIPTNQRSSNGYFHDLSSFPTTSNRSDSARSTPRNQWSSTPADTCPSAPTRMSSSTSPSPRLSSTVELRESDPSLQLYPLTLSSSLPLTPALYPSLIIEFEDITGGTRSVAGTRSDRRAGSCTTGPRSTQRTLRAGSRNLALCCPNSIRTR